MRMKSQRARLTRRRPLMRVLVQETRSREAPQTARLRPHISGLLLMTRPAAAWNSVVMCAMLVSPLHGVVPHLVPRSAQSVHLTTCVRPGTSTFAQPSVSSLWHHSTHSSVHSRSLACVGLYAVITIITLRNHLRPRSATTTLTLVFAVEVSHVLVSML